LTSFVGREREVAEVGRLLRGGRLLTLVGAPGVGKTRLALQVAAELHGRFADGAWLVELAGLAEPELVPLAVATALGVPEQGSRPMIATLAEHLQARDILLLLDNCEHLVAACAALAETLLWACPGLRILAISREALRIEGETTWRVPSLAMPDERGRQPGEPDLVASLERFEAVRLFLDRAQAVQPGFTLTAQNAEAVAQICQRLDGIPLAIELAAARLNGLSAGQIAARLDDHFALLTSGSRTALPRQQTLRGAVDWSYALLPESERTLLRHLAVFAGGWTLEAAEAVCGAGVLEPLLGLVSRSLVVAEEQDDETRYRLLEMIRQYGWERLTEAGELDAMRDRHRDWLLALAEPPVPFTFFFRADEPARLARLETEHDNLRAALAWSEQRPGGAEAGVTLAGQLWRLWWLHGHLTEGRRWLERMIALARTEPALARGSILATALGGAGNLASYQGDYRGAVPLIEEALSLWREQGDQTLIAWALHRLGHYLGHLRQPERALALCEESVALSRVLGDDRSLMHALMPLANLVRRLGNHPRAIAVAEEGVALGRTYGNSLVIAFGLMHIGKAATASGDYARAEAACLEALALARRLGQPRLVAEMATSLGGLRLAQGDGTQAALLFEESLRTSRDTHDRWNISELVEWMGAVATLGRSWEQAARLLGAAEALRDELYVVLNRPVADHDRDVATVRDQLNEAAFAASWEAGQALSLEQAIEEALDLARLAVTGDTSSAGAQQRSAADDTAAGRVSPLTSREREVALLVAQGLQSPRIAEVLVISRRTAETHVRNILGKLGLTSRAQVAAWVVRHGIDEGAPSAPRA
jgi:non-specific serine/threonine protein kinase